MFNMKKTVLNCNKCKELIFERENCCPNTVRCEKCYLPKICEKHYFIFDSRKSKTITSFLKAFKVYKLIEVK